MSDEENGSSAGRLPHALNVLYLELLNMVPLTLAPRIGMARRVRDSIDHILSDVFLLLTDPNDSPLPMTETTVLVMEWCRRMHSLLQEFRHVLYEICQRGILAQNTDVTEPYCEFLVLVTAELLFIFKRLCQYVNLPEEDITKYAQLSKHLDMALYQQSQDLSINNIPNTPEARMNYLCARHRQIQVVLQLTESPTQSVTSALPYRLRRAIGQIRSTSGTSQEVEIDVGTSPTGSTVGECSKTSPSESTLKESTKSSSSNGSPKETSAQGMSRSSTMEALSSQSSQDMETEQVESMAECPSADVPQAAMEPPPVSLKRRKVHRSASMALESGAGPSEEQEEWGETQSKRKKARPSEELKLQKMCSVCEVLFQERENVWRFPCGHVTHVKCVDELRRMQNKCPSCE